MDDILNNIRACLISTKGGVTEQALGRDYYSLIGEPIPYRTFGFNNLSTFLSSITQLRIYRSPTGENYVDWKPDEATAHISSLVARQKSKKKPQSSRFSRGRTRYQPVAPRRPTTPIKNPFPRSVTTRPSPRQLPNRNPKPVFANPPIIPQRQSVPVQARLSNARENSAAPPAQARLSIPNARELIDKKPILSANARLGVAQSKDENKIKIPTESGSKVSSTDLIQEQEDVPYVDIQWLSGRIYTARQQVQRERVSVDASPPVPLMRITPAPVPLMDLKVSTVTQKPSTVPDHPRVTNKKKSEIQQVVFKSYMEELENLAAEMGLKVVTKTIKRCPTREKPLYTGKIEVGNDKFTSFPEERLSEAEALELAAQSAITDLKVKKSSLEASLLNQAPSNAVIIDRVKNIVDKKVNGIFTEAIAATYMDQFKLTLPANWIDIVDECQDLTVERFSVLRAVVYPFPKPAKPEAAATVLEENNNKQLPVLNSTLTNPSTDKPPAPRYTNGYSNGNGNGIGENGSGCVPPKLTLPTEDEWDVFVTSCVSGGEVCLRLIGTNYDDKYNEVMNELEFKLHSTNGEKVTNPTVHEYYAANFDRCWLRVQLMDITSSSDSSDKTAEVYLIDNGEYDSIPLDDLRCLDKEFIDLPAQAIQCRLACIHASCAESDIAKEYLLHNAIGKSLIATVVERPNENNFASIVLHNTEDVLKDPININQTICSKFFGSLQSPKLKKNSLISELYLTHIDVNTPPYIQIPSSDLECLMETLDDLNQQDLVGAQVDLHKPSIMVLARSSKAPKLWRRGKIAGKEDVNRPIIHFVDYGYKEQVMVSDVVDLGKVFPPLCNFPIQAIQVNMSQILPNQLVAGVVARVRELAPPDVPIIGKVVEVATNSTDQLPLLELFKRVQPDNIIASLNTDLVFHMDKYSSSLVVLEKRKEETKGVVPTSPKDNQVSYCSEAGKSPPGPNSALTPFMVPEVNSDYFDVTVSISSNPFNFVVQPMQILNSPEFNSMMEKMEEHYEVASISIPQPTPDSLTEGAVFAAKHPKDLSWYRVIIVAKIDSNLVSVHYCDYGDIGLVTIDRLRPLNQEYQQLPSLAIKAKLHGVVPRNRDWSMEECIRFNALVQDRSFVSLVMEKNDDLSADWIVSLQLIDTSNDQDLNIADVLIEEGLAIRS